MIGKNMQKRWKIADALSDEQLQLQMQIVAEIKCPEMIAEILVRKNIIKTEEIKKFFTPSLENVHDPFIFIDMEKAVNRIIKAIQNKEKIMIYGDYDVDGTTSTSLLYLGFSKIDANVDFYIPNRMLDGYGFSMNGVNHLIAQNIDLIISVDCGITAFDEIDQLNAAGIDIIVTDHHNQKETLPNAYAIINPKMTDCKYPYEYLAGVGVAYKLLTAVYQKLKIDSDEMIAKYVDLVALGTIADIVPLTDENRIFAKIGLDRLAEKQNIGITALIKIAGLYQKTLNSGDVVFGIAPRINAAGRMGSAMRAVELMISNDEAQSEELSQIIERENSLRQQIDKKTFEEACDIIEKKYKNIDETAIILVSSSGWHPGVIGIVASKIAEKYYRPTIMISFKDGVGSGSGRSIPGFNLFDALSSVEEYLETFGGHKYAAGLSVLVEYIDLIENKLSTFVRENITAEQLMPALQIDIKLEIYEINENLMEWLNKFAPFGPTNMRPNFYTESVQIAGTPYNVGQNHLKLRVVKDGCPLDLIGFNLGSYLPFLEKGMYIDIAYSLEYNIWQNRVTIQGKLKDLRPKQE